MDANDQQQGDGRKSQGSQGSQSGDDPEALQRALQRQPEGLIGQTDENRNVDGSTTYDTLPDNQGQGGRSNA